MKKPNIGHNTFQVNRRKLLRFVARVYPKTVQSGEAEDGMTLGQA
jgi:hypothetical protein